jgi:alpha-glucosidase
MYMQQNAGFIKDGVDFWWNDEGETMYFTFYWWSVAEAQLLQQLQPTARYFSINRAYTPGMQRLGSSIWTGDVSVSWAAMQQQPAYLLNWQLAGAGYVTCDIGGFTGGNDPPDLLVRWSAPPPSPSPIRPISL